MGVLFHLLVTYLRVEKLDCYPVFLNSYCKANLNSKETIYSKIRIIAEATAVG